MRLGVEGSLSPTSSPSARTVKMMAEILCEAQKAQVVSAPRWPAQANQQRTAMGVMARLPVRAPRSGMPISQARMGVMEGLRR